jgi:integrase
MSTEEAQRRGYKNIRVEGLGRIFKPRWKRKDGSYYESPKWWISFYHRGKEIRESSESENEAEAKRLLKRKVTAIEAGRVLPREDKLTFDELAKDIENDYKVNAKRTLADLSYRIGHLREFFGMDRAIDITTDRGRAYQRKRLDEGASAATVNRELAALRRMLSLAFNAGKLSRIPKLEMLAENNVRESFLEHGSFINLLSNLPEPVAELVEFEYLCGWRQGAAKKLEWKDIDRGSGEWVAYLRIGNSKNKDQWMLPLTGRLREIIEGRMAKRRLDCPYVFHRSGRPIKDFRVSWATACKKVGLVGGRAGVIPHDLRRCAARNLSRAGVREQVAMRITGHKTASMYRRYRIVDERDLKEATESLQSYLKTQPQTPVVVPIRKPAGE